MHKTESAPPVSPLGLKVTRAVAAVGIAALGLIAVPAAPASAAAPVTLTFLNINDFHGRIDANTVKWAGTIEKLRAAAGSAPTALLSAGDNVSASLFASASQQDQPTIDVLNAIGLDVSAVGNHEFDRGYSDLTDRIINGGTNAKWSYLGANVYAKGTTTPVLQPYKVLDMGGVKVGIIGAVTVETPTLVSPAGVSGLDFGDPVAAVNRVANELTDGDQSNGEADLLIAEYHEGAPNGSATLAENIASGPAFADIVNKTSAKVSVLFTGHTHQAYVYDAPMPGVPGKTRPVLQTGSYGSNIGQVALTFDTTTKTVTSATSTLVARTTADDAALIAAYPRVAAVDTITKDAIAKAAVVGNQPVADIDGDITTAYTGGGHTGPNGAYVGGERDNRAAESALGDLVADSLLSSLSPTDRGGAEIAVVNPGGLRAELLRAATTPETADGIVRYAEANSVLPFVNNLFTTTLTGAQVKTMLEQQWQLDAAGNVPTRPYLQLGLSKNFTYTFDPARAQGDRITSITVNGAPIDPTRPYRIGTFSFLTSGGDNFRVLAQGTGLRDSGLVDRDAWIGYLKASSPLTPSFARRAIQLTAAPGKVTAGSKAAVAVSGLDLTSLGAPVNTSVQVKLGDVVLGSFPVTDGVVSASVVVPPATKAGVTALTLIAAPSGTTVTVPFVVAAAPVTTAPTTPPTSATTTVPSATSTPAPTVTSGTSTSTPSGTGVTSTTGTGDLASSTSSVLVTVGTTISGTSTSTVITVPVIVPGLASTGVNTGGQLALAGVLLFAGLGGIALGRRPSRRRGH